MKKLMPAIILTLLFAVPAMADSKFTAMDADNSGAVSWEEFEAKHPGMMKAAFDVIDTDKDGSMTHEEWDAFRNRHGSGGKGMEGMGMGKGMGGMGMGKGMTMPPKDAMTPKKQLIMPPASN